MLRFNEARLRERSAKEEAAGATPPAFFGSYSLETSIGNRRLLEDAGYMIVRWFLELTASDAARCSAVRAATRGSATATALRRHMASPSCAALRATTVIALLTTPRSTR